MLVSARFRSMFRGTLLESQFSSPNPFSSFCSTPPPTQTSLLNTGMSMTPCVTPKGGLLFGRMAGQSPLTKPSLGQPQDGRSHLPPLMSAPLAQPKAKRRCHQDGWTAHIQAARPSGQRALVNRGGMATEGSGHIPTFCHPILKSSHKRLSSRHPVASNPDVFKRRRRQSRRIHALLRGPLSCTLRRRWRWASVLLETVEQTL